jgi:hypothetical protein
MSFYTINDLNQVASTRTFSQKERIINEAKEYTVFDIFLSHCFLDREVVKALFLDLTSMGFKVYVDWIIDPHLDRANVTKQSAELIRKRMKSSKSLLLAISANATTSKWMPWELGFIDGNTAKCAIVPVFDSSYNLPESYSGYEYLKLYPYVKKRNNKSGESKLWVAENPTTYVVLDDYLENILPYLREIRI